MSHCPGTVSQKRLQFSSPPGSIRTSFSSRSLSNQFHSKKSDLNDSKVGLKVKDDNDYFDGLMNNPSFTRCTTYDVNSAGIPSDKTQLTRMRNNSDSNTTPIGLWTVAEDYPLMKKDYKKKTLNLFCKDEPTPSTQVDQPHRSRRHDANPNDSEIDSHCSPSPTSSPNLHSEFLVPSKYLETEGASSSSAALPPKVRTPTKPYPSPSLYLPPICTMTEYHGGIPSILTKEIVTFVSKIDNYDATWRRFAHLEISFTAIVLRHRLSTE